MSSRSTVEWTRAGEGRPLSDSDCPQVRGQRRAVGQSRAGPGELTEPGQWRRETQREMPGCCREGDQGLGTRSDGAVVDGQDVRVSNEWWWRPRCQSPPRGPGRGLTCSGGIELALGAGVGR